jgi:hypothetical protein
MNAANTWFAGASPYGLPTGENVLTTSYMPGSNFANFSASSKRGSGRGSLRMASYSSTLFHCAYIVTFEPSKLR